MKTQLAAEQFITEHELDEEWANFLIQAPLPVIAHVLRQGALRGRNHSAIATKRIQVAYEIMAWPQDQADPTAQRKFEPSTPKSEADSEDTWGYICPTAGKFHVQQPEYPPPNITDAQADHQDATPATSQEMNYNDRYWHGKILKILRHELDGEAAHLPVLCSKLAKYATTRSQTPDSDTVLDWLLSDQKRFTVNYDQASKLATATALPSSSWSPSWMRHEWGAASRSHRRSEQKQGQWVWVRDSEPSQPSRSSTWKSRSRSRSPRNEWRSSTMW
jgi:hypothetical protein